MSASLDTPELALLAAAEAAADTAAGAAAAAVTEADIVDAAEGFRGGR